MVVPGMRSLNRNKVGAALVIALAVAAFLAAQASDFLPGRRVLLDAHNAYAYQGRWSDRLDRALAAGIPLAIEQDLIWYVRPGTSEGRSIASHGEPFTGAEPTLRDFFERIRPVVMGVQTREAHKQWPIITLNLDFKDSHPEHFAAIWNVLGDYEPWLTTAIRASDAASVQPLEPGPILVLTGADVAQRSVFHDAVPVGSRLRLFGAVQAGNLHATNYLRWSNNPWSAVEAEAQNRAGRWTNDEKDRLRALVDRAHAGGLWIRFYTLNGHTPEEGERMGYSPEYNFGSLDAARTRWRAAIDAGVDFIATDQYEELAASLR
jgi:hypothetical protein